MKSCKCQLQFCESWCIDNGSPPKYENRKVLLLFDVHVTVLREKLFTIKPTSCTNFSNLFLEWNCTCFGQFLCPTSDVFHCTHSNGICNTGFLTACEQKKMLLLTNCQKTCITYTCVQWKTSDVGQRNCPKHVEFHSKNKFEKLMHVVGFITRNWHLCLFHSGGKSDVVRRTVAKVRTSQRLLKRIILRVTYKFRQGIPFVSLSKKLNNVIKYSLTQLYWFKNL